MQSIFNPDSKWAIQQVINDLVRQFDNTGTVTLTNSTTTTTVSNPKVLPTSVIVLQPTNIGAAAVAASTFVSSKTSGQFTITHTSTTTARVFDYVVHGA